MEKSRRIPKRGAISRTAQWWPDGGQRDRQTERGEREVEQIDLAHLTREVADRDAAAQPLSDRAGGEVAGELREQRQQQHARRRVGAGFAGEPQHERGTEREPAVGGDRQQPRRRDPALQYRGEHAQCERKRDEQRREGDRDGE